MRFVKANGLVIHYRDQGQRDRPPLVFINSLGTDFRIWSEVAEILAPDFRIITYDKRGNGLSESGPDQNDVTDYAHDLAALLDQVGVGRATILVGDQDGSTPVALVEETASLIPGSRFEIIEGAGHLPNVERQKSWRNWLSNMPDGRPLEV
jgi:pimeloyl-ACP methyl ester carboxylesterase